MQWRPLILLAAASLLAAPSATAAPLVCRTAYEAIVNLRPPHLGAPFAWDAIYGQPDMMLQLMSGVPADDGTVMVVGRTTARDGTGDAKDIVLAALNRRNRVTDEKTWAAKPGELPVKMLATKEGYAVLSNDAGGDKKNPHKHARLVWLDKDGKLLHETALGDESYDEEATAMALTPDGGLLVALDETGRGRRAGQRQGALARFSAGGAKQWQRTYNSGAASEMDGIAAAGGRDFIATGAIRLDDGRLAGLAMEISGDGAVVWQKIYPRGATAVLRQGVAAAADVVPGQAFVLAGDIAPADGGPQAYWLMATDAQGQPLWQRYFRAKDFSLAATALTGMDDGRLLAMADAKAAGGSGNRDHVRLLTLSPRGGLLADEAYIEGAGATGADMTRGWNGERVVTATILSDEKPLDLEMTANGFRAAPDDKAATGKETRPVQQGWVFVADAPGAYKDTCEKQ